VLSVGVTRREPHTTLWDYARKPFYAAPLYPMVSNYTYNRVHVEPIAAAELIYGNVLFREERRGLVFCDSMQDLDPRFVNGRLAKLQVNGVDVYDPRQLKGNSNTWLEGDQYIFRKVDMEMRNPGGGF